MIKMSMREEGWDLSPFVIKSHLFNRKAQEDWQGRGRQSHRQAALPHKARESAEERGGHTAGRHIHDRSCHFRVLGCS